MLAIKNKADLDHCFCPKLFKLQLDHDTDYS